MRIHDCHELDAEGQPQMCHSHCHGLRDKGNFTVVYHVAMRGIPQSVLLALLGLPLHGIVIPEASALTLTSTSSASFPDNTDPDIPSFTSLTLPKFDTSLGQLSSVTIRNDYLFNLGLDLRNDAGNPSFAVIGFSYSVNATPAPIFSGLDAAANFLCEDIIIGPDPGIFCPQRIARERMYTGLETSFFERTAQSDEFEVSFNQLYSVNTVALIGDVFVLSSFNNSSVTSTITYTYVPVPAPAPILGPLALAAFTRPIRRMRKRLLEHEGPVASAIE